MMGVASDSAANLKKDGVLTTLLIVQFSRINQFLILIICEMILYSGRVYYIITL